MSGSVSCFQLLHAPLTPPRTSLSTCLQAPQSLDLQSAAHQISAVSPVAAAFAVPGAIAAAIAIAAARCDCRHGR